MQLNEKSSFGRNFLNFLGVISAIIGIVFIVGSIYFNPWFKFTSNAFSDLGSNQANYQWIFNYGLITTAAIIFVYSLYLVSVSENKIQSVGGSFVLVSSIFLALIGYFHEGTYPHYFVSVYFFAQMDLSILVWGVGFVTGKRKFLGTTFILLSLVGSAISLTVRFPSIAALEAFGIIIMILWVILMAIYFKPSQKNRKE